MRIRQATARDARTRALAAGCVGNLVEWYDFALYGAFATVIAATFFPGADPAGGLLAAFAVFGVAFLARPAGALLFAHYGDRLGRRRPLAASILLAELFPTRLRYSGLSLTYGLASAIVGGTAPALATLLVRRTGDGLAPAWYATCVSAVALVAVLLAPRPSGGPWTRGSHPLRVMPLHLAGWEGEADGAPAAGRAASARRDRQ